MKATTMLDTVRSLLGVPSCAIPLSVCRVIRPYLLDRVGIPLNGTAILFVMPYLMTHDAKAPERNLSLYAVPRDYHGYVKELDAAVLPTLHGLYPQNRFALFADHSPIAEVNAAARAGLGVLGLHHLLITPAYGSFVFIGEVITDADYTAVTGEVPPIFPDVPPTCEECGLCRKACPAENACHPSACLSAITQKKGKLTPEEAAEMMTAGLIWGCDACQLACPHNLRVLHEGRDTPIPYFRNNRQLRLTESALCAMSDEEFSVRAYAWRGRPTIQRNLRLVCPESIPDESIERSHS